MVREARFLSDDPGWVDPDRFRDDRNEDDAEIEAPVVRRTTSLGRGRVRTSDDERRDPRRTMDGSNRRIDDRE